MSGKIKITVPYGSGNVECEVDAARSVNILKAQSVRKDSIGETETGIIARAMKTPIGSKSLTELARGKSNIVILTSDHTRPVPSSLTLPVMTEEIFCGAGRDISITVLIATGCHRSSTDAEIEKKFGAALTGDPRIKFVNHNPSDENMLVDFGTLPSGGTLTLNKIAANADLLVADGFIEPHQFAGFSGGRKSVLPGIASLKSVLASHNAEFTVHPASRPGNLEGNLIHADMIWAARKANLAFILNVALDSKKKVIGAWAGDMEAAHKAGCEFVLAHCGVKAASTPLVITTNGGYPLDQNIYQSTKSIMQAALVCQEGGVIIAANECRDGHGSDSFFNAFNDCVSLDKLLEEIESRGRDETVPDQWVIQLTASIVRNKTVYFVSSVPDDIIRGLKMQSAPTLQAALTEAEKIVGANAPITVLPDAVSLVLQ